jgi:hypothetical protein
VLVQRGERFVLLDAEGVVVRTWKPSVVSDEDDLWTTEYFVEGDALVERVTVEGPHAERPRRNEPVVAALRTADDELTHVFVARAFAADDLKQVHAEAVRASQADARVAAISGALDDLGLGEDVARAQAALVHDVRVWGTERAAELLRTLVTLARTQPRPDVLAAFCNACLNACSGRGTPGLPRAEGSLPTSALGLVLEAHGRSLDEDADHQESIDARESAMALFRAANAMRVAARLLG